MTLWNEVHWYEGMFLRPHHMQAAQRRMETVVRIGLDAARPYGWGFLSMKVAKEPLEKFTLRLDGCELRLKDGTWVRVPDNTEVGPLDFQAALDRSENSSVDVLFGVPEMQEVRANAVSLEAPESTTGSPRFEPHPLTRRDENTGENPQLLYVRRMRGRLFVAGDDTTGFETVRVGRIKRSDKPGALPEFQDFSVGPALTIQADASLSAMINSLSDQIEAKGEVLAREAREHRMAFTDGVPANMEHLLKLGELNEARGHIKALLQSPVLHPFDMFVSFARLVGALSVFHDDLTPGALPVYDHNHPGDSLDKLRRRLVILLDALRPMAYVERRFDRKKDQAGKDGLEVELDRKWIDDNLDIFVGLICNDMDTDQLFNHIYGKLNMKLASPTRSSKIHNIAVRGLRLQVKQVPAGTLPRRPGLHYYKVDKTIGPDYTDYWKECEQERGIRMSIIEGQVAEMEKYKPALFVPQKTQ